MTSRERVHRALRRESVDRVPIFMWFHPDTAQHLGAVLEIPAADVSEAMGDDIRQTWVNNNYAMEGIVHEHEGEGHTDFWGIRWVKEGAFNQVAGFPLGTATPDEVVARAAREQDHGTPRGAHDPGRRLDAVAVAEAHRHDRGVGLHAPDQVQRVGRPHGLAGDLPAAGPDRRPHRGP